MTKLVVTNRKTNTMPYMSVNALELIPNLEPTAELVAGKHDLNAEQIADRLETAYHEAAHYVAAASCKGAYIREVFIHPDTVNSKRRNRNSAGQVFSLEIHEHEECLVTLAGYAWDELTGADLSRSQQDLQRGSKPEYPEALEEARVFVRRHENLIRHAAHGVLALCNKEGHLKGVRLKALTRWLRDSMRSQNADYGRI